MSVIIIAEAGVNHNGDIKLAKELIHVAAKAGADYVKFQSFKADNLVTSTAPKAKYQLQDNTNNESQLEMLRKLELSEEDHQILMRSAKDEGIELISTAFDYASIDLMRFLGQEIFKIPSGEITNLPFLRYLGSLRKQVILSTGMSDMAEIQSALEILEGAGTLRQNISIMHCTSAYPAPIEDINLRAIQSIRDKFRLRVGYSDHTLGIEVPIAAVALGATIIEKHFTLDRKLPGPDHQASLEPAELSIMIAMIKNIEKAMGDGEKRIMESEIENKKIVRRSIVAKQAIKKGQVFTLENLTTKRPGIGISPLKWDEVIGRIATRDYQTDELIDEA